MQSMTFSPGLMDAVRSLKQFDVQQLAQLFKDARWFETFLLSAEEGKTVMKQFSQPTSVNSQDSKPLDIWT
ncbi:MULTISPECIES: hypothetical protein [unclassified Paenibacillus]|uniref:hypothetical protein n=1 Tax=unclassified Paenibacillus TaxID=185978 RepID=UPI00362B4F94